MLVVDLVKQLQMCDPNLRVYLSADEEGNSFSECHFADEYHESDHDRPEDVADNDYVVLWP